MNLKDKEYVRGLQNNLHATFDTAHGKEVMKFIEKLGGWTPTVFDSRETNEIIARDANRRLIGTIKTLLSISPDQVVAMAKKDDYV